ncbi:hypothetical protein AX17_005032 [Amanita inopinata Kibby_2008]|nr:hypothetical protein AX17_005032 [Amanita inopinata Kibby_2008]
MIEELKKNNVKLFPLYEVEDKAKQMHTKDEPGSNGDDDLHKGKQPRLDSSSLPTKRQKQLIAEMLE